MTSSVARKCLSLFLTSIFLYAALPQISNVASEEAYEYYGYVPAYFNYTNPLDLVKLQPTLEDPNPGWHVNGTAYLNIVGYEDGTNISIYGIGDPKQPRLLVTVVVNRMNLYEYVLPKDYHFKVVSNKAVAVSIGGGTGYGAGLRSDGSPTPGAGGSLFYPSIDGGFAGKEFIFMALPSGKYAEAEPPHHVVHPIEDAHVIIYDSAGRVVWEKDVTANSSRQDIILPAFSTYRVVSTGRIMFANWVGDSYVALPNAFGGYAGTRFFTREDAGTHGRNEQAAFLIISQSNLAQVKVFDPQGSVFGEGIIEPRKLWLGLESQVSFRKKNTMVMSSTSVIAFTCGLNMSGEGEGSLQSMRDSITFFGVKPNELTTIYIPSKGIIFSPEANARITIGTLTIDVEKGGYAAVPSGLTTLTSNSTLIIEGISDGSGYRIGGTSFCSFLITPKAVNMVYPPAKVSESGLPLVQVAAVAGVAAVVAVILAWKRPWKRS